MVRDSTAAWQIAVCSASSKRGANRPSEFGCGLLLLPRRALFLGLLEVRVAVMRIANVRPPSPGGTLVRSSGRSGLFLILPRPPFRPPPLRRIADPLSASGGNLRTTARHRALHDGPRARHGGSHTAGVRIAQLSRFAQVGEGPVDECYLVVECPKAVMGPQAGEAAKFCSCHGVDATPGGQEKKPPSFAVGL
jgi:hypothetical protein